MPENGISALKTNLAVSQMDNTASNTCANRQIYLQNLQNASLKIVYNAVCHRLYRHCIHRFALLFFCAALLFYTAASLFAFSANGSGSLIFYLNFLTALPFFLFSMFFMFMGVFHVFLFYGFNVFQCLYVLMF